MIVRVCARAGLMSDVSCFCTSAGKVLQPTVSDATSALLLDGDGGTSTLELLGQLLRLRLGNLLLQYSGSTLHSILGLGRSAWTVVNVQFSSR